MGKTVKQIAEEIGVSKQAVHQKRKTPALETLLQPFTETIDGVVYIAPEGEELLKQAFSPKQAFSKSDGTDRKPVDNNQFTGVDGGVDAPEHPLYAVLKVELDAKNQQIARLQDELAEERQHSRELADKLAQLADQAQRLHAGTIQQRLPEGGSEERLDTEPEMVATVEPVATAPEPSEPVRKGGFWQRLRSFLK